MDSVRVVGLLSSASGLGNSARLCTDQIASSGMSVSTLDVAPFLGASDAVPFSESAGHPTGEGVTIYHLNPPKLLPGIVRTGLRTYYSTYNIGYWAWELEALPSDWLSSIKYLDAIMVPSQFCADAVARSTDKPVCVVPHPLSADLPIPPRRKRGDAPFTALVMLNFGSSLERKNPRAALRAFELAFGADPEAKLIIKTSGGHRFPADLARLRAEAGRLPNVEVVDEIWSVEQLHQLYRDADAYLSLHRSEGYGLTIAEAMMMECPVIVTAWSGNMDFCSDETAFLVKYDLIAFGDEDASYAHVKDARWADPSAEDAAAHLVSLRARPEIGERKARAARPALLRHTASHSYQHALHALAT